MGKVLQGNLLEAREELEQRARKRAEQEQADYEQTYSTQATVDAGGSWWIVGQPVSQNVNDQQELAAGVASIPPELGRPAGVLVDNGP